MAGELERLLIRFDADTALLRKALADADNQVGQFAANVDKSVAKSVSGYSALATKVGEVAFGIAALAVAHLSVAKALDVLSKAGDINDLARNAGLSVEAFQELSFAIERAGGDQEEVAKTTQKFSVNMAELRNQTGAFNKFLQDQLPTLQQQLRATTNQQQAYGVLANAVKGLTSDEDRLTLVREAFGRGSADLTEVLMKGAAGLDANAQKARDLGAILDQETTTSLENAKKSVAEFEIAATAGFTRLAAHVIDFGKSVATYVDSGLKQAADGYVKQIENAVNSVAAAGDRFGYGANVPAGAGAKLTPVIGDFTTTVDTSGAQAIDRLHTQLLSAQAAAAGKPDIAGTQAAGQQELDEFRKLLADKKITEDEYEQARVDINTKTSAQVAEIYRKEFADIENLINTSLVDALGTALETGQFSAKQLFATLAEGFAKITLQALILKPIMNSLFGQGGAGSGLLLDLGFGGAKAGGGPVAGGVPYLVGENGPELMVPNTAGQIMNASQTRSALGSGSGGDVYNIDARGADISVAQRVTAAIAAAKRSQPDPVAAVGSYQRRHPYRGI